MKVVSYAQNREDILLHRALKEIEKGFYVDVGSYDPEESSVTKLFYDLGWSGINIEPIPAQFDKLRATRPRDINLCYAVSDRAGETEFFVSDNPGLSSLREEIVQSHQARGLGYCSIRVRTERLDDLLDRYAEARPIHFLKIDAEGLERNVILGNDWTRWRPWILVIEATAPMTAIENHAAWEPLILDAGYDFVHADGINRFYLAREHSERQARFVHPPNALDNFSLAEVQALKRENRELRRQLEAEQQSGAKVRRVLSDLYKSRSWRLLQRLRKLVEFVIPGRPPWK